ncbi:MAG: 3-phosphoglycerate dehydrogenase [Nitrososphaerota archaeon]|jgi:D-3-phosphoglycerate dehydrogenase|nr:3-phosphoglycerate dehydrogenase [Nitrososphaerota archaeon]MDG6937108.1 3-phosphoglycerate dehydrogenase [Nitrososphaerota archaeon]MDG6972350.1 3-phosphoglycerate dehydrogenase [Nitrososphaerota archaeon]MDG6980086.1 3-phosphoglycerate dehydrogenase [Nitrososphaerota archaeon]MDG6986914.1 3-phosphoglycerate dehydrogenase [Nitrososphaerota archaeon]
MSTRVAVYSTDSLPPKAKEALEGFELIEGRADDAVLARCQALICWPHRIPPGLLGKMKGLKMIQAMSAGVDAFDFSSLPPGAKLFSNAGAFTEAVAEHAWGLLLGTAKGVHVRNARTTPRKLRGKTIVVVGAGSIGTEVARLARSLGMRTVGVSRSFRDPEAFDERAPIASLAEKVKEADAIVMALPLTKSTRGIVTYDTLMAAKDSVIVVNVGRGESVSEEGLVRWLKERPESRFATDVFWVKGARESFDTAAWDLPNFAGTFHMSGAPLGEDLSDMKAAAAANVRMYFETGTARNLVDPSEY